MNPTLLAENICGAFGLKSKDVKSIAFKWSAGNIGLVSVEMHVTEDQGEAMVTVLKEYELVEKTDGNDV